MPTYGVNTQATGAQPIWFGDPENPKPFTISNSSLGNVNIWFGTNQSVGPNNPNESTEIAPGGYLSLDGIEPVYYVVADGANGSVTILPGVSAFFLPTVVMGAVGTVIYFQPTAPAGSIPSFSLWVEVNIGSPATGLFVYSGGSWVPIPFVATDILSAASITSALLAALSNVEIASGGTITFDGGTGNAIEQQDGNGYLEYTNNADSTVYILGQNIQSLGPFILGNTADHVFVTYNVFARNYKVKVFLRVVAAASGTVQSVRVGFNGTATVGGTRTFAKSYFEAANETMSAGNINGFANYYDTGSIPNGTVFNIEVEGFWTFTAAGTFSFVAHVSTANTDETFSIQQFSFIELTPC